MGYYVYQYLHPEYGHLYCGRTSDLDRRIYAHNNLETDNIPRKYEKLLRESVIMFVELKNKAQGVAVEAYCIDRFKPFLNISLKYNDEDTDFSDFQIKMQLPKWKMYDEKTSTYKNCLMDINKENNELIKAIDLAKKDINQNKKILENKNFELRKIKYEIEHINFVNDQNIQFGLTREDIEWFYLYCKNKNVKFYSIIYNAMGEKVHIGCCYYNPQNNILKLEYEDRGNKKIVLDKSTCSIFDFYLDILDKFYPDSNIYPELYFALLSRIDELKNNNKEYDITELKNVYDGITITSVDRNIDIVFMGGKIIKCTVYNCSYNNNYRGIYDLTNVYDWEYNRGVLLYDEKGSAHYVKEEINSDIQKIIFNSKYYSPERNHKEEIYCKKMLDKYK